MKRCPECRRDYYDDSLLYCLDDGTPLLEGPSSILEQPTVILSEFEVPSSGDPSSESPTLAHAHPTDKTSVLPNSGEAEAEKYLDESAKKQDLPAKKASVPKKERNKRLWVFGIIVLLLAAGFLGYRYFVPVNSKQIESIAVMPFVNESGSPDLEYVSDGMTEMLIGSLSQLPTLSVKARSTVFPYKGQTIDLKKIAKELDVQAILTGRMVQRVDQLILSLELVDPKTETVIWYEQYTRKQADLVALQRDIARDVSNKLRVKLTGEDEQRLVKNYTENAEAYHLFLKGRFYWDKQTESGYREAIGLFNQAIEKDPNYALAYSGLANAYIALGIDYMAPKEAFPLAKVYTRKALELAPDLAEAHAAMGSIDFFYDWNWAAADNELKRVIELNPESAEPYACTLHYLDSAGQPDDAVAEVKRVAEQHPTSIVINAEIGCSSYYAHQYDDAITELQKTLELDPNFATAYYNLGRAYGQKKMYKEAVAALTKAKTLSDGTPYVIADLGYVYGASGNKAAAMDSVRELEKVAVSKYIDAYLKAIAYIGLSDKEKALAELEKAFQARSTWLIWLKVEPKFDGLRSDPRFHDLERRIGLP